MPTWGEIIEELQQVASRENIIPFDSVRKKYLAKLQQKTGRNVILYATKWMQTDVNVDPNSLSITFEDLQGLMEVIHGLNGGALDLIVHSPGGLAEATEAMVSYLRTKFQNIRVIIPQAAMSAATMLACSANSIVMGKHSFLGPIDPQMMVLTKLGPKAVPAHDILKQFQLARTECRDPANLGSWMPILEQYGPALLVECDNAIQLSESLVSEWLSNYMFLGAGDAEEKAKRIAQYLSNHDNFRTHSRPISRTKARELGLYIEDLERDQEFQDLVLSIYHATTHTFNGTNALKIIENHRGKAFMKTMNLPPPPVQPPEPAGQGRS
ncbi:hypothetical protein [Nitrososphaera sp.]|uniref:SDH family Clp fold serine proteinase n=1 Tax=Nitrososphaera sp. TaxID=1971748 RepID=UPI00179D747F|nr:hypothetical protein [Nitrososphaera sp.]NWG37843.1 serine protease [Nitrososphaera sp.]